MQPQSQSQSQQLAARTNVVEVSDNGDGDGTENSNNNNNDAPSHNVTSSLAMHLGRRLTAPLTRANLKRCHKKFAKLQLRNEPDVAFVNLMGSTSNCELYSSSDASSLYGGGGVGERRQLLGCKKTQQKRHKTTIATTTKVTTNCEVPPIETENLHTAPEMATATTTRGRKQRKRMNFLRRSTSRFSSTSAPG